MKNGKEETINTWPTQVEFAFKKLKCLRPKFGPPPNEAREVLISPKWHSEPYRKLRQCST